MSHSIKLIAIVAICTLVTRALPFLLLGGKKKMPETVSYLGKVLPPAIMMILVVYCLKGVSIFSGSRGIPELLAITVVVVLHLWKRNTLLSIGVGTIVYMVLIQQF